jgi:hypothetical protein
MHEAVLVAAVPVLLVEIQFKTTRQEMAVMEQLHHTQVRR